MFAEKIFKLTQIIQQSNRAEESAQLLVDWLAEQIAPAYLTLPPQTFIAHNTEADPDFVRWVQNPLNWRHLDQAAITAEGVFIPVILGGVTVGVLALESTDAAALQITPLVMLVAQQMQTETDARRMTAVQETLVRINQSADRESALDSILTGLNTIVPDAGVVVIGFAPAEQRASVLAEAGVSLTATLNLADAATFASSLRDGDVLVVDETSAETDQTGLADLLHDRSWQQIWAVPLQERGLLALLLKQAPVERIITIGERKALSALASAATTALTLPPATTLSIADRGDVEAEWLLREMADKTHIAIDICDRHGNVIYWNSAWEMLFGEQDEAVVYSSRFPDDVRAIADDTIFPEVQRNERWMGTLTLLGSDGIPFEGNVSVTRLCDSQNQTIGYATVTEDMTGMQHVMTSLTHQTARVSGAAAISQAIINTENIDTLLQTVLRLLCEKFEYDAAAVFGIDSSRTALSCWMAVDQERGVDQDWIGAKIPLTEDTISRRVIVTGKSVFVENVAERSTATRTLPIFRGTQLVLPLQASHEIIGVLVVGSHEPYAFMPDDSALMQHIADQLAIALHNTQLVTQLRNRLNIMHAMSEVGLLVRAAYDLDALVARVYEALKRIHPESEPGFIRYDARREVLTAITIIEGTVESATRPLAYDLISQIVRHETPIFWRSEEERIATAAYFEAALDDLPESFMGVPLVAQDHIMGAIYISANTATAYDENDLQFLLMLGNSAAFALQNMQLLADTQQRVRELETINHISHTLSATFGDDDIWEPLLTHMADLFPDAIMTLILYNPEQDTLYQPDSGQIGDLAPVPEALSRVVIEHGFPLDFGDLLHDDDRLESFGIDPYTLEHGGLRSWVGAPLVNRENTVVGLLALQSDEVNAFSEHDTTLLNMVTAQISLALDNVRLLEAEQTRRQIADSLIDIGRVVTSTLDVDDVFGRVFEQMQGIVSYDRAAILLPRDQNGDGAALVIHALDGFDNRHLGQGFTHQSHSPLAQVMVTKEPLTIHDVSADISRWATQPEWLQDGAANSWMGVPMVMQAEVIGVITIDRADGIAYGDDDAATVFALARQAAIAVNNAKLHTQSERDLVALENRARRLASMHRIALFISSTLSQDEIFQQSCTLLAELFPVDHVSIVQIRTQDGIGQLVAQYPASDKTGMILLENKIAYDSLKRIVAEHEPLLITDLNDKNRALLTGYAAETLPTVLVAPLSAHERVLGYIALGSQQSDSVFDRETIDTFMTITAQIAVAIRNAELFQEAVDASRLKSEFLANVSHELRTPLNAIIGYSELLLGGTYGEMPQAQSDRLERVYRSGRQLLILINDILDLSKIEAGRMRLDLDAVNVTMVIQDALSSLQPQAAHKNLSLETDFQPDLPVMLADQQRLRQIIFNLLSNAIKFTKQGSVTIRLRATTVNEGQYPSLPEELAARGGQWLHLMVEDTGIGIAEADQEMIFEAFSQADGSTIREYDGTGLGLAITQRLVNMHDGHIWVDSTVGVGSTFHVLLPTVDTAQRFAVADQESDPRPLVILIDSDDRALRLFRTYLEDEPYQILTTSQLSALIEIIQIKQPAAIVLDALIADEKPAEMVTRLRRIEALIDVPIVVTSVIAGTTGVLESGATIYLKKPILREQFREAIRKVISL